MNSKIKIGSVISGYVVARMSSYFVYAERENKTKCDDYVVWSLDYDGCGVNSGRYFTIRTNAIEEYVKLKMISESVVRRTVN